jgi:solute carrier family 25 protein 33/36
MTLPQSPSFVAGRDERPFHHTHSPKEHAALIQSRETGDVIPDDTPVQGNIKALPFAKSWVHMFAGAYVKSKTFPFGGRDQQKN